MYSAKWCSVIASRHKNASSCSLGPMGSTMRHFQSVSANPGVFQYSGKTPHMHFKKSSRTLSCILLWCSWAIECDECRVNAKKKTPSKCSCKKGAQPTASHAVSFDKLTSVCRTRRWRGSLHRRCVCTQIGNKKFRESTTCSLIELQGDAVADRRNFRENDITG